MRHRIRAIPPATPRGNRYGHTRARHRGVEGAAKYRGPLLHRVSVALGSGQGPGRCVPGRLPYRDGGRSSGRTPPVKGWRAFRRHPVPGLRTVRLYGDKKELMVLLHAFAGARGEVLRASARSGRLGIDGAAVTLGSPLRGVAASSWYHPTRNSPIGLGAALMASSSRRPRDPLTSPPAWKPRCHYGASTGGGG